MNYNAIKLGMKNTFYDSPHGLANSHNKSSAFDQANLTRRAMKHSEF